MSSSSSTKMLSGVTNGIEQIVENNGSTKDTCGDVTAVSRDRLHELYELRGDLIDKMSATYDVSHSLMENNGDQMDITKEQENFGKLFISFVDTHEQFYGLLDKETDKEYARSVYEEQNGRKVELDAMATGWQDRLKLPQVNLVDIERVTRSKSSRSGTSSRSKQSRKEKMAIAQLKLEQIKRRQEIEREEQELRMRRQVMEAEMEAEQAVLSYQIASEVGSQIAPEQQLDVGDAEQTDVEHSAPRVNNTVHVQQEAPRGAANLPIRQQDVPVQRQTNVTANPVQAAVVENVATRSYNEEIVGALRQVVNAPKIEYLRFNGDPLKYVTFIRNFETCLENDNPDPERKLQLLIQHCVGKAREAIESCINLDNGYEVAKETLKKNFGKLTL